MLDKLPISKEYGARTQLHFSFPLQHDHQPHQPQHDLLEPWVFAQQYRDVSDEGYEADYATDDVFFAVQEGLTGCVKFSIVCDVVVALGEEAEGCFAAARLAEVPNSKTSPFFTARRSEPSTVLLILS